MFVLTSRKSWWRVWSELPFPLITNDPVACLFFCRWKAVQLSLGGLRQKVCPLWRAFPTPSDTHGREEVCLQCVRQAFHAQRPPDQTRPAAHDHQESIVMASRNARPQQRGPVQGPEQGPHTSCQCSGPGRQLTDSWSLHGPLRTPGGGTLPFIHQTSETGQKNPANSDEELPIKTAVRGATKDSLWIFNPVLYTAHRNPDHPDYLYNIRVLPWTPEGGWGEGRAASFLPPCSGHFIPTNTNLMQDEEDVEMTGCYSPTKTNKYLTLHWIFILFVCFLNLTCFYTLVM